VTGLYAPSRLLTVSRLRVARSCQREHHLRYGLGYSTVRAADEALRFGSLVHLGLEQWWLNRWDNARRLECTLAALDGETDPFDRMRAEVMLRGYDARWSDERWDPIAVEAEFRCPVVNPATGAPSKTWELAGKLDVLARDVDTGRVVVIEHKTSSEDVSTGSDYWKRLRLDAQVSVYFDGAAALGYEVDACVYDVLAKPGIRPLKATPIESRKYVAKTGALYANQRDRDETPEEYGVRLAEKIAESPDAFYARGEVVRLDGERIEARGDVWDLGKQIRESEIAGRYPRNPEACVRYGRTCRFFGVCTKEQSLDDPALFERLPSPHPELSFAPEATCPDE